MSSDAGPIFSERSPSVASQCTSVVQTESRSRTTTMKLTRRSAFELQGAGLWAGTSRTGHDMRGTPPRVHQSLRMISWASRDASTGTRRMADDRAADFLTDAYADIRRHTEIASILCTRQSPSSAKDRPCAVNIWACPVRIAIRDGGQGQDAGQTAVAVVDEQTSVVARARSHASPVCSEPPVSSEFTSKASPTWDDALNNGDVTKNFALFVVPCWSLAGA